MRVWLRVGPKMRLMFMLRCGGVSQREESRENFGHPERGNSSSMHEG